MMGKIAIDDKPFLQLMLILSLCFISVILFSILGYVSSYVLFDFNPMAVHNIGNLAEHEIDGYKVLQLFSAIGLFVIPPIVYAIFTSSEPLKKLGMVPSKSGFNYLLIVILMVVSTPFISWVIELNSGMVLPEFMEGIEQWMRSSERQAEEMTKAFLTFDGAGSLFYVLLIVAIVPAIGEEFLFRGVLQKIFTNWTKNAHWGIWITSILFSALHMQFFGFFPRLLLGLMFGYLFLWSKSLWLPILGHFVNNGSVVIASYFFPESIENADYTSFEDIDFKLALYIGSFLLTVILLFFIYKGNKKGEVIHQKESPEEV
jgi:membrane protease YdiL (CAAX protease family)